jgi:Fe-S cluster assembly iron-binding protein IscA
VDHSLSEELLVLQITSEAKQKLLNLLSQSISNDLTSPDVALRLVPKSDPASGQSEIGLVVDEARDEDEIVQDDDRKLLLMDPLIAQVLDGFTLDVRDTSKGMRLTFTR